MTKRRRYRIITVSPTEVSKVVVKDLESKLYAEDMTNQLNKEAKRRGDKVQFRCEVYEPKKA